MLRKMVKLFETLCGPGWINSGGPDDSFSIVELEDGGGEYSCFEDM